jgi:transposase-like protein
MSKKPLSIKQFMDRFPDDEACLDHMMRVRYGERFNCPKCEKEARYYRVKKRRAYECEHCGNQVYPTAGTPFEKTRTSLRDWFYVMFLFCASRNGVAAKEVQRQLGVTYKTAWRMCNLIRQYMGYVDGDAPLGGGGSSSPIVEADKTFIGGRDKRGFDDKTVVLGMAERDGGEVVTRIIPNRSANQVIPQIIQYVQPGSRIATDEARAFSELPEHGFYHGTVNHSQKEYVRGPVHTNTIEAFWGNVKRAVQGTYVHVSPKWLQTYLWEFEFRHNLRKQPDLMFELLMQAFPRPSR